MEGAAPKVERERVIGRGATGEVVLARVLEDSGELRAGTRVAIKRLDPAHRADATARAAFEAEAEAGRAARDPALLRVLARGDDAEGPFLVLEYVPGKTLRELLDEQGSLAEPAVRRHGAELAGALAALHGAGLVHGDLKPDNVRLDAQGRAVLLDLGFARRLADASDGVRQGGSLPYLAPERALGGATSAASDVFSLGVVLYELATGVHPFFDGRASADGQGHGPSASSGDLLRRSIELAGADRLLARIASARVPPPSHHAPELSPFFDALLAEALARGSERRPSAAEFGRRLREGESSAWWRTHVARRERAEELERAGDPLRRLPLVGRARELEELGSVLARVRASTPDRPHSAVVWLTGPAGSGKRRLLQEFALAARMSEDPALVLTTRCVEGAEERVGGAFLQLVRRYLQLPPDELPRLQHEERLRAIVAPAVARTIVAALAGSAADGDSVAAALVAFLGALGRTRLVLVSVDDFHLAGAETLGAASVLADGLGATRALILFAARSDVAPEHPLRVARLLEHLERLRERSGGTDYQRIALPPLDEEALLELVTQVFHPHSPRLALSRALWKRSSGSPGLLAEILRELVAKGGARAKDARDGRLVLLVAPEDLPRPRSLDRMIAERVRALLPEQRLWLERLSVVGGRIAPDFLVRAFPPTTPAEIERLLGELVATGWLAPAGPRFRFERPALREAVYRSMTKERRKKKHLAAARGLAASASIEPLSDDEFQRAFHLRAAEQPQALMEIVLPLVRRERRTASAQRLATLAQWGLEALERLKPSEQRRRERIELLELAADAADRLGARDEQRELLDRLVDLESAAGINPADGARIYLLHARYAANTGQFGLARGMLKNAVEQAESSGDRALSSEALRRFAHVQGLIGELGEARALALRARALAVGENQIALSLCALALLDIVENRLEDALLHTGEALETLRGASEVRLGIVAHAHLLRARVWRSAGRPVRAISAARRAARLARRAGERRLEAEARARLGGLLLDLDRSAEAEAVLRDALLVADEIEDRRGATLANLWLGLLLWESGDEQARATIERAVDRAREIGFQRAEAQALALLARVERAADSLAQADTASARALELMERQGAELVDRIAITGTRALVLFTLGRQREARVLVTELRERMRAAHRSLRDPSLRRDQRSYTTRLLEAVLSPDGPVFPRLLPEP